MFSQCRGCLTLSENMRIISETDPEGLRLMSMFTSVVQFEWIKNDEIPSLLCRECESILDISYKFQKKCQESYNILTKLMQDDTLKQDSESETVEIPDLDYKCEDSEPREVKKKTKTRVKKFTEEEVNRAIDEYKNKQNNELECIVCNYALTTSRALSTHMTQQHKEMRENWCYVCNKIYNNLLEHRQVHKNSVELCQLCDKFVKKKYFLEHLRMHSGIRPFECNVCGRGFLTSSSLKVHFKYHKQKKNCIKDSLEEVIYKNDNEDTEIKMNDDTNNFIPRQNYCITCNRNVRSLADHTNKVHYKTNTKVIELKLYNCEICDKKFRSNSNLHNHLRLHSGETPYKCAYCNKPHKSKAQMRDHERTHTGEKPYICNVCGKGFTQSGALRTHMRQHTGRPEICKICEKRFCRPSELKLHLRKHSGEKPYLCTECGKTFVQKSHLTEHTKTHSDYRPHRCIYCDKAFKQKSLLTSHLQIHAGYKRFKCDICAYACFKAYRLQQHMKLHNAEHRDQSNVHTCPVCQKSFANQTLLNAHKATSHNVIV